MQKYLCVRCCLKIAQGKGRICSHWGFLSHPQTPQQHSKHKCRWTSFHGSCFTFSSLNPGVQVDSGAWFYSSSWPHLWDTKLVPLKAQSGSPCSGGRICLGPFIPERFCPWSLMDLPVFPSQTPKSGCCGAQFHWDRAVTSPVAALLGHWPGFWGAIKLWAKPGRAGGANKLLSLFPHSVWEPWWAVKNPTFPCQDRETEAQQCVCVVPCQALQLPSAFPDLPLIPN